jgi:hypothetical protein
LVLAGSALARDARADGEKVPAKVPAKVPVTDTEGSAVLAPPAAEGRPFDGQLSTKFRINPDSPESSVPPDAVKNKNPLEFGYFVQDLLARAEEAKAQKNYAALVGLYRAVAKAVPDQAKGWSKLCDAYRLVNDRARAARSCKNAIERPGAELNDFVSYVNLTLEKSEPLTSEEVVDLKAVLDHLAGESTLGLVPTQLRCQLGVKTHDVPMLEACTAALAKAAPNDVKTVIFQWHLAVRKGQNTEAARLLERAKGLGLPAENLERMETFTPAAATLRWRTRIWSGLGLAAVLVAMAWAGWWSRKRRGGFASQIAP